MRPLQKKLEMLCGNWRPILSHLRHLVSFIESFGGVRNLLFI